jgi:glycosyltransferase involved in cell wall biosynthesis
MDILVISPTPTHPAIQGNRIRIHNVCKALQDRGACIHFLYFPREWGGRFLPEEYCAMRTTWDFFDVVPPSKDFVYSTENEAFLVDDWWDDNIVNFIKWKTGGFNFDAVIVNYIFFSKALEFFPSNTIKIIDTHDKMSNRQKMLEENGLNPEFFYTTEAEEAKALRRSDLVIAITESEQRFFERIARTPVMTLGHICEPMRVDRNRRGAVTTLGFLGSANSVNTKNMRDFFAFLAERRPEGVPGVEIVIYGGCCSVLEKGDLPRGVRLAGRVETTEEFYAAVDGILVPFRFGTGQKIKVVEALSFGAPVICTRSAADGVPVTHSAHLHESFETMLADIERFAQEGSFREALAAETERLFSEYSMRTRAAVDGIARLAANRSLAIHADFDALWHSFRTGARQDAVDEAVPLFTVLDIVNGLIPAARVEPVRRALQETFKAAIEGREPIPAVLPSPRHGRALMLGPGVGTKPGVRVWTKGEPDRAEEGVDDIVVVSGRAKRTGLSGATLRIACPAPAWRERRGAMKGVALFTDSIDDPNVALISEELLQNLKKWRREDMPVLVIGDDGAVARWSEGALEVLETGADLYQTLLTGRGLLMSKAHMAVSLGRSYERMGNLRRLMINECGPLISLVAPTDAVAFLPGECVTHDPRVAAAWLGLFLQSYETAWRFTECRRSAVSSLSWSDVIGEQLFRRLFGPIDDAAVDAAPSGCDGVAT